MPGSWPRHVLVATDGSSPADAAVVAARALARRAGAAVEMLSIYTPQIPLPARPERRGVARCAPSDRRKVVELLRSVRSQRRRLLTEPRERHEWPLRVEVGNPGPTIVRVAAEVAADLIVVGIGVREPLVRQRGTHSAISVARYATVPLYAAACDCDTPDRCVVALPGARLDAAVLRAAMGCLTPGAQVWLAVPARLPGGITTNQPESLRDFVARECGPEWAARLDTLKVTRIELPGEMLVAVLQLAEDVGAQLIAVPNHGDPGPVRAFLPNLADPLLLDARCSVLVVPDRPAAGSGVVSAA